VRLVYWQCEKKAHAIVHFVCDFNTVPVYPQHDVHLCSEDVIFAVLSFATTGAENLGR